MKIQMYKHIAPISLTGQLWRLKRNQNSKKDYDHSGEEWRYLK